MTDGNWTSSSRVEILIDDVNDNAPVFLDLYNFEVDPLASVGTLIGQLSANDSDVSDRNGRVTYHLVRGGLDRFSLHSETGETAETKCFKHFSEA